LEGMLPPMPVEGLYSTSYYLVLVDLIDS
jgi:hypothetical protein